MNIEKKIHKFFKYPEYVDEAEYRGLTVFISTDCKYIDLEFHQAFMNYCNEVETEEIYITNELDNSIKDLSFYFGKGKKHKLHNLKEWKKMKKLLKEYEKGNYERGGDHEY